MKIRIARFSDLLWQTAEPKLSPEVILMADNLPSDARIVGIIPSGDVWEVWIASETYPDKSITELYNEPSLSLVYSADKIAKLRNAA